MNNLINRLYVVFFLYIPTTAISKETVQVDKPVGEFANSVTKIFFTGLRKVLSDSIYYNFTVALALFSVFWFIGRMYFAWKGGTVEDAWKFLATNGFLIFLILFFSVGVNYTGFLSDYVRFIHSLGNSIQIAFIGNGDLSAAPEYIAKITNSVIFDTADLDWVDKIVMGFNLMVYSGLISLLVLMAYFHTIFADIFIYVLAVVGPLVIPLSLIQKLDKIFDGWVNGMISSLFYYLFVKILLSITVMIVGLGYLSEAAYSNFILRGNLNLEPSVVTITGTEDMTRPLLFFFVALMAMFGIRSFVSTMVGSSGLSGISGGAAGIALSKGIKKGSGSMSGFA